jgi:deoxycytidine triphosphate deaminase
MVLSDRDIISRVEQGDLTITPYERDNVEPASVDLRLGSDFKVAQRYREDEIDWKEVAERAVLYPEDFVLATTKERIELPEMLAARVVGRSSLGRLGISVHQTAGYVDPGFEGQITLELTNHSPRPFELEQGQRICQIVFERLSIPPRQTYGHEGSQYQDQSGATESGMDFE